MNVMDKIHYIYNTYTWHLHAEKKKIMETLFSQGQMVSKSMSFFPVEEIFRDSTGLKSSPARPANQIRGNYWMLCYQELYFLASVLGRWFQMTANIRNALPPEGFCRLNGRIMANINPEPAG